MATERLEQAAKVLLEEGMLLSALELWMEGLEASKPIAPLKEFFSNFRPESSKIRSAPATDDELMNLGSQQLLLRLKEAEEKVSLLRYQLELSNESLASLTSPNNNNNNNIHHDDDEEGKEKVVSSLPSFSPYDPLSPDMDEMRSSHLRHIQSSLPPPDATDFRLVNFLLRRHLLAERLVMTAVTLSEESGPQSVPQTWAQVGLKGTLREPPDLVTLVRYYYSAGAQREEMETARTPTLHAQLEEMHAEVDRMRRALEDASKGCAVAERRAEHAEQERKRLQQVWENDMEEARRTARKEALAEAALMTSATSSTSTPSLPVPVPVPATASEDVKPVVEDAPAPAPPAEGSVLSSSSSTDVQEQNDDRDAFERRVFARVPSTVINEALEGNARVRESIRSVFALGNNDVNGLFRLYANTLPNVVPGIILRAREEIIPILVGTIRHVDDEKLRGQLTGLLFSLVKKPDLSQRQAIVFACTILADMIGRERTERELIPQCWDGMVDKSEEKRLLVADFCGALMPFVRDSRRFPLMMNVLRPLLDDPSATVRACAGRNLGLLVTFLTDVDLFSDLFGCFRRLLLDSDENVGKVAVLELLPKLADWAASCRQLETMLIAPLMVEIQQQLSQGQGDRISLRRLAMLTDAVSAVFPFLLKATLAWAPFANEVLHVVLKDDKKRFVLSSEDENALRERMREFLKHENDVSFTAEDLKWAPVQYICRDFAPALLQMTAQVSLAERRASYLSLLAVLDSFWKVFDTAFTSSVFSPAFQKQMEDVEARAFLLPAYVGGLLIRRSESDMQAFFVKTVGLIGLEENGWSFAKHIAGLKLALELVGMRAPQRLEGILGVLRELVIADSPRPREVTVVLLERLVPMCSEATIRSTVLPALSTLSNDTDDAVRKRTVQCLGSVMSASRDAKILEPVAFQLDVLLESKAPELLEETMTVLAEVCSTVDPNFRDKFLLARLRRCVEINAEQEDAAVKARVAGSIFAAYKAFLECAPTLEVLANEVAPGLEMLQKQLSVEEQIQSIANALSTIRSKAGITPTNTSSSSATGGSSSTGGASTSSSTPPTTAPSAPIPVTLGSSVQPETSPATTTLQNKAKNLFERFRIGKGNTVAATNNNAATAPPPAEKTEEKK